MASNKLSGSNEYVWAILSYDWQTKTACLDGRMAPCTAAMDTFAEVRGGGGLSEPRLR